MGPGSRVRLAIFSSQAWAKGSAGCPPFFRQSRDQGRFNPPMRASPGPALLVPGVLAMAPDEAAVRTPKQIRLEAAHHEAGHAVSMYLHNVEIDHLELMRPNEIREDGLAGCVQSMPHSISTIGDCVDGLVEYLAGEAAFRIAWAGGAFGDEEVGGERVEHPVELLLAMPNGSTRADRAAHEGWYERADHPDERNAATLAAHITSGVLETELLLKFARARTSAMAATERFQVLCGALARALFKRSRLSGADAVAVLERADRLHEIRS